MTTKVQWKRLDTTIGTNPKPRHGHRAVTVKDLIIIFGGGNEGIVEDLNVFNCATNQWFQPVVKGDIPTGCAAFGFATDGSRILVFGGMVEYGKYSGDLWELNPLTWQWKKVKAKPPKTSSLPCARLGHTFTYADGKFYLFGGLANDSKDPKQNVPRYLNDLYALECKGNSYTWDQPAIRGAQPVERESHSCVSYRGQSANRSKIIIYGGMNGHRLGDIWNFDSDASQWTEVTASGLAPQPRSLHSSVVIGHRMFVFGGWVPLISLERNEQFSNEKEWKCTNTLASFNLETNTWELLGHECLDENIPRARAGHCGVGVNTRMYIWSGRDGYRKAWNNQVCCKDLWCLETACPGESEKVQLLKAGIGSLEIAWTPVPAADSYILQIQRCEAPIEQLPSTPTLTSQTSLHSSSIPMQSISASLFATKSPQSVLASLIPTFTNEQHQSSSASVSAIPDSDTVPDQSLSPSTVLNKSNSNLLSLAHLSSSQTPLSSSTSTPTVSQPSNSTTSTSLIFQKPSSTSVSPNLTQMIRPTTPTNIQFLNATSNSTIRPIIFHQKGTPTSSQPQLLTVMPAGVRLQQLTPIIRNASNQPTTIVRLMSAATSTIRPGIGQQIIQLNTNKQQQPLLIKAITSSSTNRQQQPILLTANPQTKTILPQNQQQVLVFNQGSQQKFTLQMTNTDQSNHTNKDHDQSESNRNNNIPQLDGTVDDPPLRNGTPDLRNTSSPISQSSQTSNHHDASQTNSKSSEDEDGDGWHLVGTFKTTTVDVKQYYVVPSKINIDNYDLATLQVQNLVRKVDLEPGVIYKIRIAAVNSCGRGPWSEAAAFKTCLPGAPPAPSNIKITKTSDGGAHLTWDPPSNAASLITGYAVYLAVKNASTDHSTARPQPPQQASQMAFVRVYGGALAECSVNAGQLLQAHLDTSSSSKPAIIFRIAARNERGYGPATQVRWLQDQQQVPNGNQSLKRTNSNLNSTAKKQRSAPTGGPNDT